MTDTHNEISFRKESSIVRHGEFRVFQVEWTLDAADEAMVFCGCRKLSVHILNKSNLLIVCQLAPLVFENMYFWMVFEMKH